MVSLPSSETAPLRLWMRPIRHLSVVVLPAPLRPTSVTSSPSSTCRSTPCSTCDSPYHAMRARTSKRRFSGMLAPEIRRDDRRVLRDLPVVALRQHLSAREDRDAVREAGDDAQVVLDHQDGAVL